ncbi:TPA: DUF5009 domain-containing protein [Candidatus Marinimicrobia bacterium]|nr:MAG: Heparan-alpha-glucosaminide N-acetyltransferase [Marinimicrobia bacterium 46_47]HAE87825.1 DUF5009 domain-containing protein [Candidatus Neomarinimicrobiota bacterium]HBY18845.1 DUF5009 domain-containing protein [Candidatus Neomarinimicrobiota bacterium]
MEISNRIYSLDVFRGLTIAAMILVNNAGSYDYVYPQLLHAEWHGWTVTDWIFPFFLFIMGISLVFSFQNRQKKGQTRRQLIWHIFRRSAILFALGLFINGFPFGLIPGSGFSLETWRIPGVLQRISLCYLFSGLIFLYSGWQHRWYWVVGLLGLYGLALKLIPVPGYGSGILAPEGNLVWFLDSTLLGKHTWSFAPVSGFDPEGILSTIPAIASTLLGVQTAHWLKTGTTRQEITNHLFIAGHLSLVIGLLLSLWLPINKNLWTSSYAVFVNGWALICFAFLYWMIDVKGYRKGTKPFVIFGMNAITVFTLSELLAAILWAVSWQTDDGKLITLHDALYDVVFMPVADPVNASLLFAVVFVGLMYCAAWFMWKMKWFVKI